MEPFVSAVSFLAGAALSGDSAFAAESRAVICDNATPTMPVSRMIRFMLAFSNSVFEDSLPATSLAEFEPSPMEPAEQCRRQPERPSKHQ